MESRSKRYVEEVAETIIERLRDGTAPWLQSWAPGEVPDVPVNGATGRPYRGMNSLYLSMVQPADDPRWCTERQANRLGGQVREEERERGRLVRFWKLRDRELVCDEGGSAVLDADGKRQYREVELERPKAFHAVLYHASQIDGLEQYRRPPAPDRDREPVEEAQKLIDAAGVPVHHDQRDRAYYLPLKDEIHLPQQGQFATREAYYATALHELGHATGHESRLDRQFGAFGDPEYAREELRAEIASYMLGTELGVGHDGSQSAAYVASWIKTLEEDPQEVYAVCRDADKIRWFLTSQVREQERTAGQEGRTVLDVPFGDNAEVKRLGGKWDRKSREWYVPEGTPVEAFAKWKKAGEVAVPARGDGVNWSAEVAALEREESARGSRESGEHATALQRARNMFVENPPRNPLQAKVAKRRAERGLAVKKTRLHVPFSDNAAVKRLGARWDRGAKVWYAPEGTDLGPLEKWVEGAQREAVALPRDPVGEFRAFLEEAGLVLDGPPLMDGQRHRVPVEGGRRGTTDGTYVGYLDGRPAGYVRNWKTGVERRWRASLEMEQGDVAALQAEVAERRAEREAAREAEYEAASDRATQEFGVLEPATTAHPYLAKKGLDSVSQASFGAKVNEAGDLVVPLADGEGRIWTQQMISESGFKHLMKGGRASGCYHVIGQLEEENVRSPDRDDPTVPREYPDPGAELREVWVTTGFGTGAVIHAATQQPVVCAISDANLTQVAEAMHERFPDHRIVVLGDDDRHLPAQDPPKPNSGREKAESAAAVADGIAVFPRFGPRERGREFTDFADVARAHVEYLAREGHEAWWPGGFHQVKRQIEQGIGRALTREAKESQRDLEAGSRVKAQARTRQETQTVAKEAALQEERAEGKLRAARHPVRDREPVGLAR